MVTLKGQIDCHVVMVAGSWKGSGTSFPRPLSAYRLHFFWVGWHIGGGVQLCSSTLHTFGR